MKSKRLKRCPKCGHYRDRKNSFYWIVRRSNGYKHPSSYCKKCVVQTSDLFQKQNKEWHHRYVRHTADSLLDLKRKLKNKPCADCEKSYPYYVMDFDHVRGKKLFAMAQTTSITRVGRKKLLEEAAKCEVVCSNCHRERTYRRTQVKIASSSSKNAPK